MSKFKITNEVLIRKIIQRIWGGGGALPTATRLTCSSLVRSLILMVASSWARNRLITLARSGSKILPSSSRTTWSSSRILWWDAWEAIIRWRKAEQNGWWAEVEEKYAERWVFFCADILVAVVYLGGDLLLQLLELITRQSAREELWAPFHQLPHQSLYLLHTFCFISLGRWMQGVTLPRRHVQLHFPLLFYHKELPPYAPPLSQRDGYLLHQGHFCSYHQLLVSAVRCIKNATKWRFREMDGAVQTHSPSFLNVDLLKVDKIGREQSLKKNIERENVFSLARPQEVPILFDLETCWVLFLLVPPQ